MKRKKNQMFLLKRKKRKKEKRKKEKRTLPLEKEFMENI